MKTLLARIADLERRLAELEKQPVPMTTAAPLPFPTLFPHPSPSHELFPSINPWVSSCGPDSWTAR